MEAWNCIICGREIREYTSARILLKTIDESGDAHQSSTNFALEISSCCGDRECADSALSIAKSAEILDIESFVYADMNSSDNPGEEAEVDEFEQSEVCLKMKRLNERLLHAQDMERHLEELHISTEIINLFPMHAKRWLEYYDKRHHLEFELFDVFEQAARKHVVMRNRPAIRSIIQSIADTLNIAGTRLSSRSENSLEVLMHNISAFLDEVDTFERIYEYILENPNSRQKKIYKQLSIQGIGTSYMFEYAEMVGVFSRIRQRDSWLVSVKSQ